MFEVLLCLNLRRQKYGRYRKKLLAISNYSTLNNISSGGISSTLATGKRKKYIYTVYHIMYKEIILYNE